RGEDALQQLSLAIGGAAEDAQVAPADAVAREFGDRPDDLPLGLLEVARAAAHLPLDHPELDQLTYERRLRAGLLAHVLERVQGPRVTRADHRPAQRPPVGRRGGHVSLGAARRELLADYPQRQ